MGTCALDMRKVYPPMKHSGKSLIAPRSNTHTHTFIIKIFLLQFKILLHSCERESEIRVISVTTYFLVNSSNIEVYNYYKTRAFLKRLDIKVG